MLRNTVTEFRLSRGHQSPAPSSFCPAVEALEERTLLNGTMVDPMPADPQATAIVLEVTAAVRTFDKVLSRDLVRFQQTGSLAVTAHAARFESLVQVFSAGVTNLTQAQGLTDPVFLQAVSGFNAALAHYNHEVGRAAALGTIQQFLMNY